MSNDIFRTVKNLLDWPDSVLESNAVHSGGHLYEDSITNLVALRDLEPHIRELVDVCVSAGIECDALYQIIRIIGDE